MLTSLPVVASIVSYVDPVHATGMQGHMYIAELAQQAMADGDLKTLLKENRQHFLNGAYLPDSGYAAMDGYGEIAHWDQFVEAYVQWIQANYQAPYTGEAAQHIAVVMGAAAHGMADQSYDILFFDKVAVMDGNTDSLDESTDVYVVLDRDRKERPEAVVNSTVLADIFKTSLGHEVAPSVIDEGMSRAYLALGVTILLLTKQEADYRSRYPWASEHYLDEGRPGAYPHTSEVVKGYLEHVWRRVNGDPSLEAVVVGSNPKPNDEDIETDHTNLDSWVTFFMGEGFSPNFVNAETVFLTDPEGNTVPCNVRVRGDAGATTIQLQPQADLQYETKYTAHLTTTLRTLHDVNLPSEYTLTYQTKCAPEDMERCHPELVNNGGAGGSGATGGSQSGGSGGSNTGGQGGSTSGNNAATNGQSSSDGGCSITTSPIDNERQRGSWVSWALPFGLLMLRQWGRQRRAR